MKIECTSGRGNFQIVKGTFAVLKVDYTSWFSSKAEARYKGVNIEIQPQNFFRTKFGILKNGIPMGRINYHWKRTISINWIQEAGVAERSFLFRSRGAWKHRFELLDESDNLVLTMYPKWIWRKFDFDYDIEADINQFEEETLTELLIYCGFAARLYKQKKAAASAG
ncbi:MAG: hypothetical protein KDC85_21495 [Saprospiraceae bacterium]|nr:hypothetical protein [Saprospiraceae bacterium]MCB9324345.1 aminotransferase [Lewinellaceae bacterium]